MSDYVPTPGTPALYLLGGIALRGVPEEAAHSLLTQSKAVALVAYLALSAPETFQRRDRIVGLLWPELDQTHARTQLRKTVHTARSALGESAIVGRGDEALALSPESLWSDTAAFQLAVEKNRLGHAIELYRGDLMPGFFLAECNDFDSWLENRRTEFHEGAVAACLALAKLLEAEESHTEAAKFAKKAARLADANERVLRRSLVMLDRLGDRAGALRLFEEFVQRFRRQMEADPSEETMRLGKSLKAGRALT